MRKLTETPSASGSKHPRPNATALRRIFAVVVVKRESDLAPFLSCADLSHCSIEAKLLALGYDRRDFGFWNCSYVVDQPRLLTDASECSLVSPHLHRTTLTGSHSLGEHLGSGHRSGDQAG